MSHRSFHGTSHSTSHGVTHWISYGTSHRTTYGTSDRTSYAKSHEISYGISHGITYSTSYGITYWASHGMSNIVSAVPLSILWDGPKQSYGIARGTSEILCSVPWYETYPIRGPMECQYMGCLTYGPMGCQVPPRMSPWDVSSIP